MVDATSRADPVPAGPAVFPGVTIALAAPLRRLSLRARDPAPIAALTGAAVPACIGDTAGGLSCLGPDEWLLHLPLDGEVPAGEGAPLAVVDVSDRAIGLVIEGARAIDVLSSGCPRDIARFPDGYVTRTIFDDVEIILWRDSATRFRIDVWRSFAPWLWTALTTAAAHG